MNRTLLIGILLILVSGLLALNNSDASNLMAKNDTDHSLSLSNHRKSQVWKIADGTAKPVNLSGDVNRESARTEFNLQIELMPDGQIQLNWDDVADATGYNIYHSAYPAPALEEVPWELWETLPADSSEYSFYPTEAEYINLGFFYITAITPPPPVPENFVYVPGGTFTMGGAYGTEQPLHSVTLNAFYMSKYQLTQAEYAAVMGSNPSSNYGVGADYPVYYLSWYSALKYCNLRSIGEGLTPVYSISGYTNPSNWGTVPTSDNSTWNAAICNWTANGYRLPTEAEWEYAARGATNDPDYLYSGSDDLNAVAWYVENNSPHGSKPVGTKAPNALGLYDMSGNLWEWCWDWHGSYSSSPINNPTGPNSGSDRVLRGGTWWVGAIYCRVAGRYSIHPYYGTLITVGFRVARSGL